jgi:ornithine carbamoyltransferase
MTSCTILHDIQEMRKVEMIFVEDATSTRKSFCKVILRFGIHKQISHDDYVSKYWK